MTMTITIKKGVLTPLCSGNPVAQGSGNTEKHNPWELGVRAYLVQASSENTEITVGGTTHIAAEKEKVVILTDSDGSLDGKLEAAFSPKDLFNNSSLYAMPNDADIRFQRVYWKDGAEIGSEMIDFSIVVHSESLPGYSSTRTATGQFLTIELPGKKLRTIEMINDDVSATLHDGSPAVVISSGGGSATAGGGGDDNGMPWPPK
jgi:hypothetical protein